MYTPRGNAAQIIRAITQCRLTAVRVYVAGRVGKACSRVGLFTVNDLGANQFEFDDDLVLDRDKAVQYGVGLCAKIGLTQH